MPTVTTEGIILNRKNFGEADRVLTVLTDRYGKIPVIARGVRKITSRRSGHVELINRVKMHLFKGKNYTLTEAESLDTFAVLKENLTLSTTAFHIVELVDRMTVEGQKNPRLYELVAGILKVLEKNPRQVFIRAFEVKLMALLGFWSVNAVKDLDPGTRKLLLELERSTWDQIAGMEIDQVQALALEQVLRYYIEERVLESGLKSVKVLKKIPKRQ